MPPVTDTLSESTKASSSDLETIAKKGKVTCYAGESPYIGSGALPRWFRHPADANEMFAPS